jgi:hypothetical protein
MSPELRLFAVLTLILVCCIVGMAIEARINRNKGDNGMRRRMTDKRRRQWPAPSKDCQRFGEDWKIHKPDVHK